MLDYAYEVELISAVKSLNGFFIAEAVYLEGQVENPDPKVNFQHQISKVEV